MFDTFHGLPEDELVRMLGGNVAEFFGFDVPKLESIAARIGPEKAGFRDP